jgi:hypothetical protein
MQRINSLGAEPLLVDESNHNDSLGLDVFVSPASSESTPLLEATKPDIEPIHITQLPQDIWNHVINRGFFSARQIVSLSMTSRAMQQVMLDALTHNLHADTRREILAYLDAADHAYLTRTQSTLDRQQRNARWITFAGTLTIAIALSSLQMDGFQMSFLLEMKKVVDQIVREGSYQLWCTYNSHAHTQELANGVYYKMLNVVPDICYGFNCAPSQLHVTDGPAGFWFANFVPALAYAASTQLAVYAKATPIAIVGLVSAIVTGGCTAAMPLLNTLSIAADAATKFACCQAFNVAEQYIYNAGECCDPQWQEAPCYSLNDNYQGIREKCDVETHCKINSFTPDLTGDTSATSPLLPMLASVPALAYSTIGVIFIAGFSIWRKVKSMQAENNRLPETAVVVRRGFSE